MSNMDVHCAVESERAQSAEDRYLSCCCCLVHISLVVIFFCGIKQASEVRNEIVVEIERLMNQQNDTLHSIQVTRFLVY